MSKQHSHAAHRDVDRQTKRKGFLKKGLAGLAATAVVASGLVFANTAAHAAEPINGKVFLDYGGDGAYTNSGLIQDSLLGGVTVTAYNAAGDVVSEATTSVAAPGTATSNYTLNFLPGVNDGIISGSSSPGSPRACMTPSTRARAACSSPVLVRLHR